MASLSAPRLDTHGFQVRSRFRCALRRAGVGYGDRVLLAVSGGLDSMALLDLGAREASSGRLEISVGHVDHALRPSSIDDARFVAAACEARGFPVFSERLSWGLTPAAQISEADARRARYAALRRMAAEAKATVICTAHTRDDQVETLLMNLVRGGAVDGLGGIALRRRDLVRPLLSVSRPELLRFVRQADLSWREDESNLDPRFLRNRIRHVLLPLLESEIRPGIRRVLARSAMVVAEQRRYLRRQGRAAWLALAPARGDGWIQLERPRLASYHRAVVALVLRRAYRALAGTHRELSSAHLRPLAAAVRSGQKSGFDLPARIRALVDIHSVRLESRGRGHDAGDR